MKKTVFKNVIVIGYGKIVEEILKTVYERRDEYGYKVFYIEHEVYPFNFSVDYANENAIPYLQIMNKDELHEFLIGIEENTLIISASNNYLFPKDIVEKENMKIVNFHNALLPKYPGRNAPSWAIFHGEKETGITWHYVDDKIDAGNIIIQKKLMIDNEEKAYELASRLMDLASNAFRECYADILEGEVSGRIQFISRDRVVYKAGDVPGNARFSVEEDGEYIYRLLRAVDYGKNNIFPRCITQYNGKKVEIIRYKRVDSVLGDCGAEYICIPLQNGILKIKYSEIHREEV